MSRIIVQHNLHTSGLIRRMEDEEGLYDIVWNGVAPGHGSQYMYTR